MFVEDPRLRPKLVQVEPSGLLGPTDPEHVVAVKQGVNEWYCWKRRNRMVIPDFSDAELVGLDLRGANIHSALVNSRQRPIRAEKIRLAAPL
jgi:hypothetical protein